MAFCLRALIAWSILAAALSARDPELRIVVDGEKKPIAVELFGAPQGPSSAIPTVTLTVHVLDDDEKRREQALAGRLHAAEGVLRFTPQFAFRPGLSYEAV